jgi:serine/threonine-protein kinase
VIKGPPEPAGPRAARYGVTLPPGFDAWFARGTAVDPADRFGSATEAVEALRALYDPASLRVVPVVAARASVSDPGPLTAESGSAHVTSPALERDVTTIGAPTARSRAPLVAATMLGLSVIGAAGWLLWRSGDAGAVPSRQPGAVVLSAAPAASVSPPVDVAPPPVDVVAAAPSVRAATMPTTPAAVASGARPVAVAKPAAPPAATVKKPRPERSLLGRD